MRIGELAKKAGVTVQSVRFYERRGLLKPPPRTASGYRNYHQADVDRIAFIKWCQPLGFTLKEVRELIPLHSALATEPAPHRARPAELQKLIRIALQKSADVQARITLMKQAGKQLRFAINKLQNAAGPLCPAAHSPTRNQQRANASRTGAPSNPETKHL
jgi:MerR family copper efflux transcriptional regulator